MKKRHKEIRIEYELTMAVILTLMADFPGGFTGYREPDEANTRAAEVI